MNWCHNINKLIGFNRTLCQLASRCILKSPVCCASKTRIINIHIIVGIFSFYTQLQKRISKTAFCIPMSPGFIVHALDLKYFYANQHFQGRRDFKSEGFPLHRPAILSQSAISCLLIYHR